VTGAEVVGFLVDEPVIEDAVADVRARFRVARAAVAGWEPAPMPEGWQP
jgi:hypothetical protein